MLSLKRHNSRVEISLEARGLLVVAVDLIGAIQIAYFNLQFFNYLTGANPIHLHPFQPSLPQEQGCRFRA